MVLILAASTVGGALLGLGAVYLILTLFDDHTEGL